MKDMQELEDAIKQTLIREGAPEFFGLGASTLARAAVGSLAVLYLSMQEAKQAEQATKIARV